MAGKQESEFISAEVHLLRASQQVLQRDAALARQMEHQHSQRAALQVCTHL